MLFTRQVFVLVLAMCATSASLAQVDVPPSSLYVPKPSRDLSWAHGLWVARGEHPTYGAIVEWKVTISPNGTFTAEVVKENDQESGIERGVWSAVDRDFWTFTVLERDRRRLALPEVEMYSILAIAHGSLEFRHISSGKVLRLELPST